MVDPWGFSLSLPENILHSSCTKPPSWGIKFFSGRDCSCYYLPHPPGVILQIPSLTAGNTEIWLCKHIKGILTKREGCSHTGLPGHSALGKEFFPPKVVLWRQRHGLGRQNHIQQPFHQAGLPPFGFIHVSQACGLLIAFRLFDPPPLPPTRPCP